MYICPQEVATKPLTSKTENMKTLNETQVNKMSKLERSIELDRLEDLMCNTDYLTAEGSITYDKYAKSARVLINKANGEF